MNLDAFSSRRKARLRGLLLCVHPGDQDQKRALMWPTRRSREPPRLFFYFTAADSFLSSVPGRNHTARDRIKTNIKHTTATPRYLLRRWGSFKSCFYAGRITLYLSKMTRYSEPQQAAVYIQKYYLMIGEMPSWKWHGMESSRSDSKAFEPSKKKKREMDRDRSSGEMWERRPKKDVLQDVQRTSDALCRIEQFETRGEKHFHAALPYWLGNFTLEYGLLAKNQMDKPPPSQRKPSFLHFSHSIQSI